jgi:hypothetical protein
MTDEIEDMMDRNWKTEQREVAAVKLAASRQDEICALKTQLGDLGHLANELRAKLELQEAENASFAESISHANAVIGRLRDEAEELKLRSGGLHAENALLLTESSLRGEKVDALTRRLDASKADINSLRKNSAALKVEAKPPPLIGGEAAAAAAAVGIFEGKFPSAAEPPTEAALPTVAEAEPPLLNGDAAAASASSRASLPASSCTTRSSTRRRPSTRWSSLRWRTSGSWQTCCSR